MGVPFAEFPKLPTHPPCNFTVFRPLNAGEVESHFERQLYLINSRERSANSIRTNIDLNFKFIYVFYAMASSDMMFCK